MEARSLKALVTVAREGGFSRAAQKLHLTQSAVSKAVKHLEDELQLPLLDRTTKPIQLTEAGRRVYQKAVTILAESETLKSELQDLRGLKTGTLRLGLPSIGSTIVFAHWFAVYRRQFPGVSIHLTEGGSKSLEAKVLAGELDLAAALLPVSDAFDWQEARREPIDVLLPATHPLATRRQITFKQLSREPFILYPPGFALRALVMNACKQNGFEPNVVAESSQVDFVMELVSAGMGIAFVPRMIARQKPVGATSVPVKAPSLHWHLALISRRGGYLSEAARAWLELGKDKSLNIRGTIPPRLLT